MAFRPAFAVLMLAVLTGPAESAWAGGLFSGFRSQQRRTTQQHQPQKPEAKPDPLAEFRPPGAPRVETDRRRYRPGYVSANPADTIKLVDQALERSQRRTLAVGPNTPWQILHGVLALREDFNVRVNGRTVPAIEWLSSGISHNGVPLIEKTEHGGRCHPYTQPYAFEGHTNQFLAIMSVAGLPTTHEFKTPAGEVVTMGDMVEEAKASVDGKGEMTWTLWFLTHYLEPDAEWENAAGQFWSMERLVQMESRHKVEDAPCGGMHRLFALALARNAYIAKHKRVRGAWLEADQKVKSYEKAARSLQNRDGSFSAAWYKGREYSGDLEKRLKTSGHTLEWLMVSVTDKELKSPWMQKAVQSVARDVTRSLSRETECGAFYHSLDALAFYKMRVTPRPEPQPEPQPEPTQQPQSLATKDAAPKPAAEPTTDALVAVDEPLDDLPNLTAESADTTAADETAVADSSTGETPDDATTENDGLEPIAEDDMPLLTRLPEGIDDEAAPLTAQAIPADGPLYDAVPPIQTETDTDAEPKAVADAAPQADADAKKPAAPPTKTAAKAPEVRQLAAREELIVEDLDLPNVYTPPTTADRIVPQPMPLPERADRIRAERPIDVPMAIDVEPKTSDAADAESEWQTPIRTAQPR